MIYEGIGFFRENHGKSWSFGSALIFYATEDIRVVYGILLAATTCNLFMPSGCISLLIRFFFFDSTISLQP